MNAEKSNTKTRVTKRNLVKRCTARGFTVTSLAAKIGRARPVIYFALERPSRYTETYKLIQEVLA